MNPRLVTFQIAVLVVPQRQQRVADLARVRAYHILKVNSIRAASPTLSQTAVAAPPMAQGQVMISSVVRSLRPVVPADSGA